MCIFPTLQVKALSLPASTNGTTSSGLATLASRIHALAELRSAQLQSLALKDIITCLPEVEHEDFQVGLELVVALLHAPHSRPNHRQILAGLKSLPPSLQPAVQSMLTGDLKYHSGKILEELGSGEYSVRNAAQQRCLNLASPLSSILSFQEFSSTVQPCALELLQCMIAAVVAVADLSDTLHSNMDKTTNIDTESCETTKGVDSTRASIDNFPDIVSNIYTLTSLFGIHILTENPQHAQQGKTALVDAVKALVSILQKMVVGIEMMASVGAALHGLLDLPAACPMQLAALYARAFFLPFQTAASRSFKKDVKKNLESIELGTDTNVGVVVEELQREGWSIEEELKKVPVENAVPAVRGLLQRLPVEILYAPLQVGGKEWCFVTDGALLMLCTVAQVHFILVACLFTIIYI